MRNTTPSLRHALRLSLLVAATVLLPLSVFAKTVVVYHTSDIHGSYFAKPWYKGKDKGRLRGGFAALASLLKSEKHPYLLLDSGDIYQGTPEGTISKGEASIRFMNALGYDASVIGNHEFDAGENNLKKLVSMASFPFLGANIFKRADKKLVSYAKEYVILERDGVRIGVIGLASHDTNKSTLPSNVKHLYFPAEGDIAKIVLKKMRGKKVDVFIAIAHTGLSTKLVGKWVRPGDWNPTKKEIKENLEEKESLYLARKAKKLVAVFGGHYHTAMIEPYKDPKTGTLILQSGHSARSVSRLEMVFDDKTGKFKSASGRLIDLWVDQTGEDEDILRLGKVIKDEIGKEIDVPIGRTSRDVTRRGDLDSHIGNWVTDIMRAKAGVEVGFQNVRGIRADLRKGIITMRQMYEVMPFDNTLVTMKLTGAQIEEVLRLNNRGKSNKMLVSGLKYSYRLDAENKPKDFVITVGGSPIDPTRLYTVVTNNYLSSGGSGGDVFLEGKDIVDTFITVRDVMAEDVRRNKPLKIPRKGRAKLRK